MAEHLNASWVELTHDPVGVKLAPGTMVARIEIGAESFDMPRSLIDDFLAFLRNPNHKPFHVANISLADVK